MEPRITVLTLAVDDLERALAFYRDGCGFPTEGIVGREYEHGAVAFFDLHGGLKLAVWERDSLAHDAGLPRGERATTEFSGGTEEIDMSDSGGKKGLPGKRKR